MHDENDADSKSNAPAVTRAIRILGLLADERAPLGLTEISRALGIAKSSTSNLCNALEEGRLISRSESGYALGRRTVELGGAYLSGFDQVREFYKFCTDSAILNRELVQIAVLDGTEVLYLARHEGRAPLRLSASIGDRYPASITAVGNALLALLPDEEVRARFADESTRPRLTQHSESTVEGLIAKLHATRDRGYSLDEGEVHPSVIGVARVLPPRASGESLLAIGASIMSHTLKPGHVLDVAAELERAAVALSNPIMDFSGDS